MLDVIALIGLLDSAVSAGRTIVGLARDGTRNEAAARRMLCSVQRIHDQAATMVTGGLLPGDELTSYAEELKVALSELAAECTENQSLLRRSMRAEDLKDRMNDINALLAQFTTAMQVVALVEARREGVNSREQHDELMEVLARLEDRATRTKHQVYTRSDTSRTETAMLEDRESYSSMDDADGYGRIELPQQTPDALIAPDNMATQASPDVGACAQFLVTQLQSRNEGKLCWAMEAVRNALIFPSNCPVDVLARHLRDGSYLHMAQVPVYSRQHQSSRPEVEASLVQAGVIASTVALVRNPATHWAAMRTLSHLSGNPSYHAELVASGVMAAIAWSLCAFNTNVQIATLMIVRLADGNIYNQIKFASEDVLGPLAMRVFTAEYAKAEAVVALRCLALQHEVSETETLEEQAVQILLALVQGGNLVQQAAAVDTLCVLASMKAVVPVLKAARVDFALREFASSDGSRLIFSRQVTGCRPLKKSVVARALYSLGSCDN